MLELGRKHANGRRDMGFFSRPDWTKEQELEQRKANAGVKLLRDREPDADYCERNGKIALFKINLQGVRYLHS